MNIIEFNPKILKSYFSLKVQEACRACKRYGYKNSCPPLIPTMDYYQQLLPTYNNGMIIYKKFTVSDMNKWEEIGKISSLEIHNYLLKQRTDLIKHGYMLNLALTAGSCKLCNKCSTPCSHPDQRLVPIEGTGIDVFKLMKHFNVDVNFPVETYKYFYRVGMLLW